VTKRFTQAGKVAPFPAGGEPDVQKKLSGDDAGGKNHAFCRRQQS
jgi:hypothetical protein